MIVGIEHLDAEEEELNIDSAAVTRRNLSLRTNCEVSCRFETECRYVLLKGTRGMSVPCRLSRRGLLLERRPDPPVLTYALRASDQGGVLKPAPSSSKIGQRCFARLSC